MIGKDRLAMQFDRQCVRDYVSRIVARCAPVVGRGVGLGRINLLTGCLRGQTVSGLAVIIVQKYDEAVAK